MVKMETTDHDLNVQRAKAITRRKGEPFKVLGGNAENWLPRQLRCVRVAAHAVRWSFEAARKIHERRCSQQSAAEF